MIAAAPKIVVEKDQPGRPHQGKVFVAVHAHLDDAPYFAGGLCVKLTSDNYKNEVQPSEADMRGYFKANLPRYQSPEKKSLAILIAPGLPLCCRVADLAVEAAVAVIQLVSL